jgi:hypothetical protein
MSLRILSVETSISTTNVNGEYLTHGFRLEICILKKFVKTEKIASTLFTARAETVTVTPQKHVAVLVSSTKGARARRYQKGERERWPICRKTSTST